MTNRMIEPITIKGTFNQVGMSTPPILHSLILCQKYDPGAARSVIARRTREPAREQRGTSRNYTGCCACGRGRCLLLDQSRHRLCVAAHDDLEEVQSDLCRDRIGTIIRSLHR